MKSKQELKFKENQRNSLLLFPPSLEELIPIDHLVRFVDMVVENMDVSEIMKSYKQGGAPIYHPRIILKVLFYGYLNTETSSRILERRCKEDICYMWLTGMQQPNYVTIANFRSGKLKGTIEKLFGQLVKQLFTEKLIDLKDQTVDGTKIESVSGRYTYVWRKNVERHKGNLDEKIKSFLKQVSDEMELNGESNASTSSTNESTSESKTSNQELDSKDLQEKIDEIKKKSSSNKNFQKLSKELQKCKDRLAAYEVQLSQLEERNSYSKTDPDATFMRMKEDHNNTGQAKPAYNVQLSSQNQFVINCTLHSNANDAVCYIQHMEDSLSLLNEAGLPNFETSNADSVYGTEENYQYLDDKQITTYLQYPHFYNERTGKMLKKTFDSRNWYYNSTSDYYVCPMGQHLNLVEHIIKTTKSGFEKKLKKYEAKNCGTCPLASGCIQKLRKPASLHEKLSRNRTVLRNDNLEQFLNKARQNLTSEKGIELREQRGANVESVFGQIKRNKRFRRFTHRSKIKADIEFKLYCIGSNLKKMYKRLWFDENGMPQTEKIMKMLAEKVKMNSNIHRFFEKLKLILHHYLLTLTTKKITTNYFFAINAF